MADVTALAPPGRRPRHQGRRADHLVDRGTDRRSETATTTVQGSTPSWLTVRGRTLARGPLHRQSGRHRPHRRRRPGRHDGVGALQPGRPGRPDRRRQRCPADRGGRAHLDRARPRRRRARATPTTHGHPDHDGRRAHLRRDHAQLGQLHRRAGPLVRRPDRRPTRRRTTSCSSSTGSPTRPTPTSPSPRSSR